MPDYLSALEFACKSVRSLIVGKGAPTLPGPLDDGDLLAAAEESRESWEPNEIVRPAFDEERLELLKSDPEAFFRGHKQRPWWSAEAVAAHQRALDTPIPTTADLGDYPPMRRNYAKCGECNQDMILRHYCEPPTPAGMQAAGPVAPEEARPEPASSGVLEAICDVLANHAPNEWHIPETHSSGVQCFHSDYTLCSDFDHRYEWRAHVAPLIANALDGGA